jgi:hypothetical protein
MEIKQPHFFQIYAMLKRIYNNFSGIGGASPALLLPLNDINKQSAITVMILLTFCGSSAILLKLTEGQFKKLKT